MPPAVPTNGAARPPSTKQRSDDKDGPTLADLSSAYWTLKKRLNELRARTQLPAFREDDRMQLESSKKLKQMTTDLADMEGFAKRRNWWGRILAMKPKTSVHHPSSGLTARVSKGSNTRSVAEYTYGKITDTSKPWRDKQADALFVPASFGEERVVAGRQWKSELLHTRAMGSMLAEYSNFDAASFRDSHHRSGGRRTLTKLLWAGIALGLEAFGIGVSRRVLAGDVPFDFFPQKGDADWVVDDAPLLEAD